MEMGGLLKMTAAALALCVVAGPAAAVPQRVTGTRPTTISSPVAVAGVRGYKISMRESWKMMRVNDGLAAFSGQLVVEPLDQGLPWYLPLAEDTGFVLGTQCWRGLAVEGAAARPFTELVLANRLAEARRLALKSGAADSGWHFTARLLACAAAAEPQEMTRLAESLTLWKAPPEWARWRLLNLAGLWSVVRHDDKAAECLRGAARLGPPLPADIDKQLSLVEVQQRNLAAARSALDRAAVRDSADIDVHILLGTVALLRDDAQAAVSPLRRAVALDYEDPTAHFLLSRAFDLLGNAPAAISEIDAAIYWAERQGVEAGTLASYRAVRAQLVRAIPLP